MKIKLTAHIHFRKYHWDEKGEYQILYVALPDDETLTYICAQEVEVEIPDNYDPRAQQVAALEKQKQKVMADYQTMVAEINNRISKLQALEYTA
ncbi:hypothetical protein UFOVP924_9 [uncultured Caudovirales phage]|uniref:Uncharacterized protein n=1 Tax=uncultured Caudovirales phage TaxID=2100421 RepID=A0A6J5PJG9_9CAUD|nr:hypothetical protein UFOVP924_9 [uncultured Caudovirales phage]CAB4200368.1 hypothetical protein UFOVP1348_40 [uncultured Caudovirales phage]